MNDNSSGEWKVIGETLIKNDPVPTKDTTKIAGIYGLKNKTTGKWYVGQSKDIISRWERDYKKINCKNQRKLYNALKKYGFDGFDKVVLEECEEIDWIIDYREMYWIRKLDSASKNKGYNLKEGGSGGGKCSVETKQIMRNKKIGKFFGNDNPFYGRKHTPETKYKLSTCAKNRIHTEETKEKIRQHTIGRKGGMSGKSHTPETIEKIRLSSTGRKHSDVSKMKISQSKKNLSEETRRKLGKHSIGKKYFLGKKHTPETIEKMKLSARLRWERKISKC
jgi:hypothetical protein